MGLGAGMMTGWADPSTGQLWPSIDPATGAVIGSGVVSARVVEAIPAVGRMPLTLWEAGQQMETPSLLARPDPGLDYPTLMSALCWDYWVHGNAVLYDTVVDGDLVLASMWVPAERVNCWNWAGLALQLAIATPQPFSCCGAGSPNTLKTTRSA